MSSSTTSSYALVEIKCEDTLAFYEGYVKDVDRDMVLVAYEGGWQRDAWLNVSSLRPSLSPYNVAQFNPLPGEVVEVKAKSAEHEPYSWWRGSVKSVRPNPQRSGQMPDSLGSTSNQLIYEISYAGWENEFTETLEKEMLRPFNKQPCYAAGDIEKVVQPMAPHIAALLTTDILQSIHYTAGTLAFIIEPAGSIHPQPSTNAAYTPPPIVTNQPHLNVIGTKQSCQRAIILLANQLKSLTELQQQQQQQQQQFNGGFGTFPQPPSHRYDSHPSSQQQQQHQQQQYGAPGNYGVGGGSHRQSGSFGRSSSPMSPFSSHPPQSSYANGNIPYSASNPPFSLEFHCPPHLMGMVIGKRHKNLYIAENLEGIYKVHVDTENGSIVVLAKNAEAANAARSLLELTEQTLQIPSVIVGRVVGKNFSIIKEIEQHSGVLRIKVGDDRDHDMEYLQQLAINGIPGVNQNESNQSTTNPDGTISNSAPPSSAPTTEKRSAFALSSYRDSQRGRRGFHEPYFHRGGSRYEDSSANEEFDIVALEDDKTVEISIIGSPATVSEAELLLRTHIGLITQIYKLSYDEAMLKRQVEALSLVVPGGKHLVMHGTSNASTSHSSGGASSSHSEKRRPAKDHDTNLPAWAVEKKEEKSNSTPVVPNVPPSSAPRRNNKQPQQQQQSHQQPDSSRIVSESKANTDASEPSPEPSRGSDSRRRGNGNRRGGGSNQRRQPREKTESNGATNESGQPQVESASSPLADATSSQQQQPNRSNNRRGPPRGRGGRRPTGERGPKESSNEQQQQQQQQSAASSS